MFQQKVAVHYRDGSTRHTTLTQWSWGQFALYCQQKSITYNPEEPGLVGILMLRHQAWSEMHRDPGTPRPAFDAWDVTVDSVEPLEEPAEVDPTQTATSEG